MNKITTLLLGAVMALTLTTLPAAAADEIVTKSQVVRFSDLNLSSDEGVRALYQRIRKAARQVCAQSTDWTQYERGGYRSCYFKAVNDAVDHVNRPALTAMHRTNMTAPAG